MVRFFQFRAVEYGGTFALFLTFINYVFGFYGDFSTGVFCRVLYAQLYAQHVFCVNSCLHSGLFSVVFDLAAAGGAWWLFASCGYAVLCSCPAFFAPFPGGFGVYE